MKSSVAQQFVFEPRDLAPGDHRSAALPRDGLEIHCVSATDPEAFAEAYDALWAEFGPANELESREVLLRRLARRDAGDASGREMRYDLLLLKREAQFVAVRDHTVIADERGAVVHLSHVLIAPAWRRSGLGGWLRALPLQTARAFLNEAGLPLDLPITLVAEMEYPDGIDTRREVRLAAYRGAGFKKVDPAFVAYHQPDFRPPEVIDDTGGPKPPPFQLVLRRLERENEGHITGEDLRTIVESLYRIYAKDFREQDMRPLWDQLITYPDCGAQVPLIAP